MHEAKYGECLFPGLPPRQEDQRPMVAFLNGDVIKGCNSCAIHWVPRVSDGIPELTSWNQMKSI